MATFDEVRVAAFQIKQSGDELSLRLKAAADQLNRRRSELARVVGSTSRSGQEAVQQVSSAERQVRDSAVQLLGLNSSIRAFLADLAK